MLSSPLQSVSAPGGHSRQFLEARMRSLAWRVSLAPHHNSDCLPRCSPCDSAHIRPRITKRASWTTGGSHLGWKLQTPRHQANYRYLPKVRTATHIVGDEVGGWAILTDGGTHASDGETTAGWSAIARSLRGVCFVMFGPVITAEHVAFAGASQHTNHTGELSGPIESLHFLSLLGPVLRAFSVTPDTLLMCVWIRAVTDHCPLGSNIGCVTLVVNTHQRNRPVPCRSAVVRTLSRCVCSLDPLSFLSTELQRCAWRFGSTKNFALMRSSGSSRPPAELPGMAAASTGSSTRSSSFSQTRDEEHNVWNPVPGSAVHFHVAKYMEEMLGGEQLGIIAMSCRFALDLLCDKK